MEELEKLIIMRIHSYKFPDGVSREILLQNGCPVILKTGEEIYVEEIPLEKEYLVDYVSPILYGIKLSAVKALMKKYGGSGWTEHCERDGSIFEVTEIKLNQNNSRFKYNHHL